jgi:hypothetical protein
MADTTFWRLRLKGDLSPDQAQASLPENALDILRIDKRGSETQVYFSHRGAPQEVTGRGGERAEKVTLDAVTKVG